MNKETLEHLSSLMDGELSHETSLFVARRLGSDPELGAAWERYHLIRECLRRPGQQGLVGRVSLDLDDHATEPVRAGARTGRRWLRPLSGAAIAASVALAAVLLVAGGRDVAAPEAAPAPFASPSPNLYPYNRVPDSEPVALRIDGFNDYLLRHNRAAGEVGRQGFVSYLPFEVTRAEAAEPAAGPESDAAAENDGRRDGESGAGR